MTNDVAGAMRFYGDLLGWKYRIEHASNCAWTGAKADYPLTIANGQAHGGFVNPDRPVRSCWLAYVAVPDVDATITRPRLLVR